MSTVRLKVEKGRKDGGSEINVKKDRQEQEEDQNTVILHTFYNLLERCHRILRTPVSKVLF